MTQRTNTINQDITEVMAEADAVITRHMSQDLRNAILIVSVVLNLFVFTAWLAIQATSQYDSQIASFLFN